MSAAEIIAEVLAEHKRAAYGRAVLGCSCGALGITTDDAYSQHGAQLVAERLQAADVGACGATGGGVEYLDIRVRPDSLLGRLKQAEAERDELRAKVAGGLHRLVNVHIVDRDDPSRVVELRPHLLALHHRRWLQQRRVALPHGTRGRDRGRVVTANEEVIHWLPDAACPALDGHYIRRSEWLATSNPEKVTCKDCDLSITPEQGRQRQERLDAYFASVLAAYNAKDRQ